MNWYKKSQQIELGSLERQLKSDPETVNHVISVLSSMLLLPSSQDNIIANALKQLKQLQNQGKINYKIGPLIVEKMDKAIQLLTPLFSGKLFSKEEGIERLRKLMEQIV